MSSTSTIYCYSLNFAKLLLKSNCVRTLIVYHPIRKKIAHLKLYIYTVSLFTNHMLACWWAALRLSTFLPVFFPIPAKELFESHPVRGWNPKSALHICSPSSWDTLFTGTNLNRPFTPVWNHNSSHERLWKCTVRMTSTSSVIRFSFY